MHAKGERYFLFIQQDGFSLPQPDHQRGFLPQHEDKLLGPPSARFAELHVEMPEHPRKDAADFRVRQTRGRFVSARLRSGETIGGHELTFCRCSCADRWRMFDMPISGRRRRADRRASVPVRTCPGRGNCPWIDWRPIG